MDEIIPGLFSWSTLRETIGQRVHSAYVAPARLLIDPMVPPEGMGAFSGVVPKPELIVLTGRHHRRHSARFVEAFDCAVFAHASGLNDLADAPFRVRGFRPPEQLADGVIAEPVGVLCADESALHLAVGPGVLAVADGVTRKDYDGELAFVADRRLGDEPEQVKRGLAAAYRRLCDELDFDVLLLAHGAPIVRGGREALRTFADSVG